MNQSITKSQKALHSATKKIKKTTPVASSKKKEYDTHTDEEKWLVIQSIMKALGIEISKATFCPVLVLKCIKNASLDDLNPILSKVLVQHIESFVDSSASLKQWRKKLKEWIKNLTKPETRGGVLVTEDQLPEFKERLIAVLKSLKSRSFDILREAVVKILQDMNSNSSNKRVVFNQKKACSKHFWYAFLEKNPDIKEIYERIPIIKKKRTPKSKCAKNCFKNHSDNREEDYETANSLDLNTEPENDETFYSPVIFASEVGNFEDSSPFSTGHMEEAKEEEVRETSADLPLDVILPEFQVVPKYDFYKSFKRIVETEDNEYQRECFKYYFNNWK